MKSLINYLIVSTLFLDKFILFRSPFNFYLYYLIFLFFLIYYTLLGRHIKLHRNFFVLLLLITIIGLLKATLNNYSIFPIIKQFTSITFSSIVYYLFIKYNNFKIVDIFKIYLRLAFWVCVVGLLQQFLFIIGFRAANPIYAYKLCSIMSEPAHLAIVLSPAFFVSVNRWIDGNINPISKLSSLSIILAYILTLSGVALFGIVFTGIIIIKKHLILGKKHLLLFPAVFLMTYLVLFFAYKIPDIKMRVDDTWKAIIIDKSQQNTSVINISTFALFSNYLISKEAFSRNPFFGTGLGTHATSYDKYINQLFPNPNESIKYQIHMALNRDDANSLFIRLVSETGLFGLGLFMIYLIKLMLSFKCNHNANYLFWLINNSILIFFVLRLIRFGNYSALGFFLFFFIYYLTYTQAKIKKNSSLVEF